MNLNQFWNKNYMRLRILSCDILVITRILQLNSQATNYVSFYTQRYNFFLNLSQNNITTEWTPANILHMLKWFVNQIVSRIEYRSRFQLVPYLHLWSELLSSLLATHDRNKELMTHCELGGALYIHSQACLKSQGIYVLNCSDCSLPPQYLLPFTDIASTANTTVAPPAWKRTSL